MGAVKNAQSTSSPATASSSSSSKKGSNQFQLDSEFVEKYRHQRAPFGFNGLGNIVYQRTYSRLKENGEREQWFETVERVVNGTFNMQKRHMELNELGWNPQSAQVTAQKMFDRIFHMKFLPPGRGLWAMGSPLTEERGIYTALNNCAFVSTTCMFEEGHQRSRPFTFLMDASMLGVGVGFDTRGAATAKEKHINITGPDKSRTETYVIEDSREGWVKSLELLIESYFDPSMPVQEFDYEKIRPAGLPIKGFGGVSSGSAALKDLHLQVRNILEKNVGAPISVTSIVDIMNLIGKCVVAGNIRRTAEIAFGDPNDEEYIDLKNYEVNPHRIEYGWTSNNSVFAELGMDYSGVCARAAKNGEPGFAWLENAQNYGRMEDPKNMKDRLALGGNPCLEQTLESFELCCLVEIFPNNHETMEEFLETIELAFMYAKTVTLGKTHWAETNRVMLRNRRIGTGLSGIAQFISKHGIHEFKKWCEEGYAQVQAVDDKLSRLFCIPHSIKTTTVKPSGTVSLLAGATPGLHFPESRYCIRRVRIAKSSELIEPLRKAGYKIEDDVWESSTYVVEIPIDHGEGLRGLKEVSMWEQLSLTSFLQRYWSDNQVSCTVTFDPETEGDQMKHALDYFQYQLKGISFLPRIPAGVYPQMPYEAITEDEYFEMASGISKVDFHKGDNEDPEMERFCDGASCAVEFRPSVASRTSD
ncbi:PFL-like glycyl radical enzyme [Basidiobolus meristosporus CBS 931.73]|uniref:ribonucleoside-triphosphate reductase (thioredoxin) n=1 Tax=Basidiobolus meristosporus CBS 931.73 TaxID=1314790 RepID=A0A1Y1VR08_9FUNG|nr:PFL-like glycyl radical enzyme [Basidiobolus meristosporus CBS 931.73]|eukprot:ORX63742.1 PFL-like glycyl radical enzyme [Basidiobolus meristosporus CBS 931.73]